VKDDLIKTMLVTAIQVTMPKLEKCADKLKTMPEDAEILAEIRNCAEDYLNTYREQGLKPEAIEATLRVDLLEDIKEIVVDKLYEILM